MDVFEKQLRSLDTNLFRHVLSQSTEGDKKSFLALQQAMGEVKGNFVYLEIGSYLGGSLQPYVLDRRCVKILSIDPRPRSLPDVRGSLKYKLNTTENMLKELSKIPGADLAKIITFEAGTDTLDVRAMQPRPDLCFVDGEHTDRAVLRDAQFCRKVLNDHGAIAFHDANIVYFGIKSFVDELVRSGVKFRACNLPDSVFLVELGDFEISRCDVLEKLWRDNYKGYLWSLIENDGYRRFYHQPLFQMCRSLKSRTWDRAAGLIRKTLWRT